MRLLVVALALCGLAILPGSAGVPVAMAATPVATAVPLTTSDGERVVASVYAAKSLDGVVLVHGLGGRKEEFATLAARFARAGLYVASIDLRGHGVSPTSAPLTPSDHPRLVADVRAATAWLYQKGVKRVALVGAELGANLALAVAAEDPAVVSVVLLSAGMDQGGVLANPALLRYNPRPLLLVASADDAYGARTARTLDALATGPHQVILYDVAGKGTRMLARQPDLEPRILGFVSTHWLRPTEAPPPTEITVEPKGLETSGPPSP
jgi:alpha-beta hydrolase superfamily lysophospholipase